MTTYRLQLHKDFTLFDVGRMVGYLAALGVTDVYLSPIWTARPGSTHGYDVCSHDEINPEIGGAPALDLCATALASAGMGLILDIVPNHMSNDAITNEWWRDLLENGPSSPFAEFFDVDWDPVKPELKDRLLLPILAEQYGEALETGALQLEFDGGVLVLRYGGQRIPINPRRAPLVFGLNLNRLETALGEGSPDLREFLSILTALRNLPPYTERDTQKISERRREKEVARDRLDRLVQASKAIRAHIGEAVRAFNGARGDRTSFDRLHELLELQAYRLASWRVASDEINYRRFFDINELAGLRVESPKVFDQIHRLVLQLIAAGTVTGLRVDHVDGLFDPAAYLGRLQEAARERRPQGAAGDDFYIVVEKILSPAEALREDWPVAGTTGYNFLNEVGGLFIDPRGRSSLQRTYVRFTGRHDDFGSVAYESKRLIVSTALSSEFQVLAQAANRLSERDRRTRDFTLGSIRRALREVVACFPVYRTYVSPAGVTGADRAAVDEAITAARRLNPAMDVSIFEFLRRILLRIHSDADNSGPRVPADHDQLAVAMRFQQYTAPVQAKGVEDTAFYRSHVLTALNEVGGDPRRFGRSVDEFHRANLKRLRRWPGEMLATTTHDTKRAEDARARLQVISELPEEWRKAVASWVRINRDGRLRLDGRSAPDGNDEYLFYQALVGAWPPQRADDAPTAQAPADLTRRIADYMIKAIREAKTHTSWITPNQEYEAAVSAFAERSLRGDHAAAFLASFVPFARRVSELGVVNSLAQLVLKIVSPGVPDFYQGSELWDLSLVDPDNRRPIDFNTRRAWLEDEEPWLARASVDRVPVDDDPDLASHVSSMLDMWPDGRIKLFLTACGLRLRRARPLLLRSGDYVPLRAEGVHAGHVVALARRERADLLLAVVPRLSANLVTDGGRFPVGSDVWSDTRVLVPSGWARREFRELLTGSRVVASPLDSGETALMVSQALRVCPVALLWSGTPGD